METSCTALFARSVETGPLPTRLPVPFVALPLSPKPHYNSPPHHPPSTPPLLEGRKSQLTPQSAFFPSPSFLSPPPTRLLIIPPAPLPSPLPSPFPPGKEGRANSPPVTFVSLPLPLPPTNSPLRLASSLIIQPPAPLLSSFPSPSPPGKEGRASSPPSVSPSPPLPLSSYFRPPPTSPLSSPNCHHHHQIRAVSLLQSISPPCCASSGSDPHRVSAAVNVPPLAASASASASSDRDPREISDSLALEPVSIGQCRKASGLTGRGGKGEAAMANDGGSSAFWRRAKEIEAPMCAKVPFSFPPMFGDVRDDPHHWLRDERRENPQVLAHLAAENATWRCMGITAARASSSSAAPPNYRAWSSLLPFAASAHPLSPFLPSPPRLPQNVEVYGDHSSSRFFLLRRSFRSLCALFSSPLHPCPLRLSPALSHPFQNVEVYGDHSGSRFFLLPLLIRFSSNPPSAPPS
ncbi:unnamed protein product, partial [Closterium sp. Naga37s-1]